MRRTLAAAAAFLLLCPCTALAQEARTLDAFEDVSEIGRAHV